MCDETQRIQDLIPHWQDHSVGELFPEYVMARFHYEHVRPGHCLVCGRPLASHEVWPRGRCPRSMCDTCYQREILGKINYRCIISGDPLPQDKIYAQQINPREVGNNLADGYARDYYTLLASKVVGINMTFLRDEIFAYQKQHIDSDYREIDYQLPTLHPQALPSSRRETRALPPPPELLRLQHQIKELGDLALTKPTHKWKVIRHIPLWGSRERN